MNVFLVHGTFGKPFENWFPWIEEELAKREIICTIPTFPTPNHQTYSDWEILFDYYCTVGMINEDTVLVGHSCGSVFLVDYLSKHKIHVKGLVVFSGYNNFISGYELMDRLNKPFYLFDVLENMNRYADKVYAFYGNDDPNIPQNVLMKFSVEIGAQAICVPNAGHFNSSAGYTRCDILLDLLQKEFM